VRLFKTLVLGMACALAMPMAAQAQAYPDRPIRIISPFAAGGVVDVIARTVGAELSNRLGQPVIVENRVGAGGAIGTDHVAKSPADGYTLLTVSPGHAVVPALNRSTQWHPTRDFAGILGVGVVPNVIVVHPSVQANTLAELIALARRAPESISYGSAGIGTSNHLSGELLAQMAGVKLMHVPYKSQPDAISDLLAGRVNMMPLTTALALRHIETGGLRPLAVTTAQRSAALPNVPTVAEAGPLPGYEVATWFGFVTHKDVPRPIIERLQREMTAIMAMPAVRERLTNLGMEIAVQDAAAFDRFVQSEVDKWAKVIQQAGLSQR
jgi:tripartite-type tricarboxylate transporter receptor subunit TctC